MRALTDDEKRERRDRLADVAGELFRTLGWSKLTMDAVAATAGVSKGAVFLAFASKEDLVLHAVGRRFEAWFERLIVLDPRRATLARDVRLSLQHDALLLPLLALVGPILEVGCTAEAVVRFKEGLATNLARLGEHWAPLRPEVALERWAPLFLRVYALIVGAWVVGEASDAVRSALAGRSDLQALLTRFDDLVEPMLEAELRSILPA